MPHALLDLVHRHLADAGFALAAAIDRLPKDRQPEAIAVAPASWSRCNSG
jgi:hypothetical protein